MLTGNYPFCAGFYSKISRQETWRFVSGIERIGLITCIVRPGITDGFGSFLSEIAVIVMNVGRVDVGCRRPQIGCMSVSGHNRQQGFNRNYRLEGGLIFLFFPDCLF